MVEIQKPERVYFLGAGASKTIYPDLPLAKDLTLRSLVEYGNAHNEERAYEPLRQLRLLLEGPFRGMDTSPIEEVLGKAELAGPDRTSIVQCILYRLSLEKGGYPPLLRTWLIQVRSKGHAIVTTNYDTVCERNLEQDGAGSVLRAGLKLLDYGISDDLCVQNGPTLWRECQSDKCLLLLKLHGSVSWSRCLNASCGRYMLSPVALFQAPEAMDDPYVHWAACPDCGGEPGYVLVPPVKNKQYDDKALGQIWTRAKQVLRSAREIVFAGYSLPPSDEMVREMLCDARDSQKNQKVIVVNKNASAAQQFKGIYDDLVCEGGSDWCRYLEGVAQDALCPGDSSF